MRATLSSLVVLAAVVVPPTWADDLKPLQGVWEGFLVPNPVIEMRLVFRVEGDKVTMASPDQGPGDTPVDEATRTGQEVVFRVKKIAGTFTGTLDDEGKVIAGKWEQGDNSLPLELKKTELPQHPPEVWEGAITTPGGIKLRIRLRLTEREPGVYRATMDSPDQGAAALKVAKAERQDGRLTIEVPNLKAEFRGETNAAGDEVVGEFQQAGATFPLTLKKVVKPTEARRTQQPKPPFPYEVEEVAYDNPADGNRLSGTLTRPSGDGPFPTVLLITGSGPQDRDESLLGHKPFLVLADALTRRGIAVLRVDDRGVGQSTGEFAGATSVDFAEDVRAGVAYLKSRREVDPGAIGLIGHSEGGLIAPMVAAKSKDVAFLVLMAGTGLTGAEILEMQTALILKAAGGTDAQADRQRELIRQMSALVRDEADDAVVADRARALVATLDEDERAALGDADAILSAQVKQFTSPWFRYFLTYDPRPTLTRVTCPVLAINGEKDLQVPAKENLAEIAGALKAGGNDRVTIEEFPGLNHLFQACQTGSPTEYAAIEETINPVVLDRIADWITRTTGRAG